MLTWAKTFLILAAFFVASFNFLPEASAEENATSCRLVNGYYKNSEWLASSSGIKRHGRYFQAVSTNDCKSYCKDVEQWRLSEKDSKHGMKVNCLFGEQSLYKADHKPANQLKQALHKN